MAPTPESALRSSRPLFVVAVALFVLVGAPCWGQQGRPAPSAPAPAGPRALGIFESWTAIEIAERAGKVCYALARVSESQPRALRRGEAMMVVTHRPGQAYQVSYQSGFPYKDGAPVVVEIDRKRFELFTRPDLDPDSAWTRDGAADKALVEAMRGGRTLSVKATSVRGTEVTDAVPLAGFSRALAEINRACAVR